MRPGAGPAGSSASGAGAVLLMTAEKASALGLTPKARIVDHCLVGTDPRDVGQQVRGVCIIDSLDNLDTAMADLRRWNRYPRAILFLGAPVASYITGASLEVSGGVSRHI